MDMERQNYYLRVSCAVKVATYKGDVLATSQKLLQLGFDVGASVNTESYHVVPEKNLWPEVKIISFRQQCYYQQDGHPCHCSKNGYSILLQKFYRRVISRRTNRS